MIKKVNPYVSLSTSIAYDWFANYATEDRILLDEPLSGGLFCVDNDANHHYQPPVCDGKSEKTGQRMPHKLSERNKGSSELLFAFFGHILRRRVGFLRLAGSK